MTRRYVNGVLDFLIKMLEFFFVLLVLLECNSVWRQNIGLSFDVRDWSIGSACLSVFLLILLYIVKDKSNVCCVTEYLPLFFVSVVFCLEFNAFNSLNEIQNSFNPSESSMIYGKSFLIFFLIFMNLMTVLFRIYRKNKESFRLFILLEYVILILAFFSVILWFGACVLELWGKNSDVYVNWGGQYYDSNYLNLCIRRWIFEGDIKKNLGIFVEPPMFGLMLGYGLYTELFLKKKTNPGIVVIFCIALISCRAILGIMVAMLAFVLCFMEALRERKNGKWLSALIILCMIAGCILLIIYKSRVGWGSFATHIDDFIASFKCWLEYPIIGCGFDYPLPIFEYMSDFRADNIGLSNSAAVVLAEGGIVLFTYYVLPFAFMAYGYFKGNRRLAYWAIGMFAFWVVVIFHTRLFMFFLLALGYSMVDLRTHLFQREKKTKQIIEFKLHVFEENQLMDKHWLKKDCLILPNAFVFIMSLLLFFSSCWGLVFAKRFSVRNGVISVILIFTEIVFFVLAFLRKRFSKKIIDCVLGMLWLIYMCVGQPYQVLDHFYSMTGLHFQDSWWRFIVLCLIIYALVLIINKWEAKQELTNHVEAS